MAKQVISALVYGVSDQPGAFPTPRTWGISVNAIRSDIIPLGPTIKSTSLGVDPSLAYKVYAAIPQIQPSNAGTYYVFTSRSVADIINDINN